jgi:hypothetical protein
MHTRTLLVAALVGCSLAGCSGERALNCEAPGRYAAAVSVQPVQIPDDLSPPDESQALRLPPDPAAANRPVVAVAASACLESPPAFSSDGPLGRGRGAESNDASAPAAEPASNVEREIGN